MNIHDNSHALQVGSFLEVEKAPNLKNLSNAERKKVVDLMQNYKEIALGNKKSPINEEEASSILHKLKSTEDLGDHNPAKSLAKKMTSAVRTTVGKIQEAHKSFREEMVDVRKKDIEVSFLGKVGTVGEIQAKRYIDCIREAKTKKYDQSTSLNPLRNGSKELNAEDVKQSKQEWLRVLQELGSLKVGSDSKARGRVKEILGCVLSKLAITGSLDEEFEKDWKDGKYGEALPKYDGTFEMCMAASYAIRGELAEAKKHVTEEKKIPDSDVMGVINSEGKDSSKLERLKKIMEEYSTVPAFSKQALY